MDPSPGGSIGVLAAGSTEERRYPRRERGPLQYLNLAAAVTALLLLLLRHCTATMAKPGSMTAGLQLPSAQSACDLLNVNDCLYAKSFVSLPYVAVCTCPCNVYAVRSQARHMAESTTSHWHTAIGTFSYTLNSSARFSLYAASDTVFGMVLDTKFAGDLHTRKSTTGYVLL